jgi:hypothetical protein
MGPDKLIVLPGKLINRVFKYLLDKIQGFESNKQGDKSNKIGYKK